MKINDLHIGQEYSLSKKFSNDDVIQFSEISMDSNPIHLSEEYAERSLFRKPIVHGFLTGSLFSAIIGTKLPGEGSIYLNQEMSFRKPVYHNEEVRAVVSITDIDYSKNIVFLKTILFNSKNEEAIIGKATVKLI